MVEYVLGFLFDTKFNEVVLLVKDHPDWQKGKLNGVGGKIEPKETPIMAMSREFQEEAGVDIPEWMWIPVLTLHFQSAKIHVFTAIGEQAFLQKTHSRTSEQIVRFPIGLVMDLGLATIVDNVPWLIRLCLQRWEHKN